MADMVIDVPMGFKLRSVPNLYALDEKARTDRYGPAPINPFFKLRDSQGMSIVALASASNMDRKAISRLEVGMYATPLPSAIRYWVDVRNLATEGELWADYEDFQYLQRKRHPFFFGPTLNFELGSSVHPFRQLRLIRPAAHDLNLQLPVGLTECCEALCLPLDTIQFWEKKFRLQQSVPKTVKAVLNRLGYTRTQISVFEADYKHWRIANKQVTST